MATTTRSLAEARNRGLPFDVAWQSATSGLPYAWQAALAETRQHWYRAYCGRPPACRQAAFLDAGRDQSSMSRVYQPAFRISKQAQAERQRAQRLNPVHVYRMSPTDGRRCIRCGCRYGDPHRAPCVPDPHIP
jgi:hypothetical protein